MNISAKTQLYWFNSSVLLYNRNVFLWTEEFKKYLINIYMENLQKMLNVAHSA